MTLRSARCYAGQLTAIVTVADDGGSSGRLRELLDVVALGDMRKCLVALAEDDAPLAKAFEESLAIMKKCWTEPSFSHHGENFSVPPTYTKWNHKQTIAYFTARQRGAPARGGDAARRS